MTKQTAYKLWSIHTLLWAALVLALVGSMRHVAWGFSTLEQGDLIAGYVQAVAVDLGLFALALGIQNRKRQARGTRVLWAGVVLFSGVSTYANLLHGLRFQTDLGLTSWGWLVSMRPVVLSGVLPMLVLYLAEVAGDDVNYTVKLAEKEAKRQEREATRPVQAEQVLAQSTQAITPKIDTFPTPTEQARQDKTQRVDQLLTLCAGNPDMRVSELASQLGVSRTTVYDYVKELTDQGRLARNGSGWEIVNLDKIPAVMVGTLSVSSRQGV